MELHNKVNEEDPCFTLGECIWSSILSLLPLHEAIATSALSTCWKNVWTWVPHIDIAIATVMHKITDLDHVSKRSKEWIQAVHKILTTHHGPIQSCILDTKYIECSDEDVNQWIEILIQRSIGELIINGQHEYEVPTSVFKCKTLHSLELGDCALLRCCNYSSFMSNNLRTLKLHSNYLSVDMIQCLLNQCRYLEKLTLDDCIVNNGKDEDLVLQICAPQLKRLKIVGGLTMIQTQVHIRAPRLTSLKLGKVIIEKDVKVHAPELQKFVCKLEDCNHLQHTPCKTLICEAKKISAILKSIAHIKILKLCRITSKCLFAGNLDLPTFKVKKLNMETDLSERKGTILLSTMLRRCPTLEELKIISVPLICDDSEWQKKDPSCPTYWEGNQLICVKKTLKTISILDFKEHDIDFLKFIATGKMVELLRIDYKHLPAFVVNFLSDIKGKLIIREMKS